ncbi:ABC-2 type transport system ATP-binding protein [Amycolatopsis australiensis]|uniref:ABC-2 type transport system ATP-binding protein n=1 Tax=Amycolatopsis australiensis TaxID=546364 RepID=A0A1K1SW62_9PSEU|nr:ABC-2 type transport system ATP-binding protein [Amycolatopsis australiensis]
MLSDAITVTAVVKRFPQAMSPSLDRVSFRVAPGEVFGVLGFAGAGKSTVLGVLATRLRPTGGRVLVGGTDVAAHPVLARRSLALLPGHTTLDPAATTRQNLLAHATYHLISRPVRERRADQLLESLELRPVADARAGSLTPGEALRVMLARALMHDPRVLLVDEPRATNAAARGFLRDRIVELKREGVTVVLASRELNEIEGICDRVAVLDRGKLVATGKPATLIDRPRTLVLTVQLRGVCAEEVASMLGRMRSVRAVERSPAEDTTLRFRLRCDEDPARLLAEAVEVLGYVGVTTISALCGQVTLADVMEDLK